MSRNHAHSPRNAAWLVAFMWGAYLLNYGDRQAVFAMLSVFKQDLDFTDTQLGLIGSIFLWVYGLSCPLAGFLADRFSKRWLVVLSLVIWSVVTIATGLAHTAVMMLGLRAAMGLSEALYMPAAISLTANAHPPQQRSRAVATLTTAQIVGTVAGAWFGGWMAEQGNWRAAFWILGTIGLLYAIPYFAFLRTVSENPHLENLNSIPDDDATAVTLPAKKGNPYAPQLTSQHSSPGIVSLFRAPTFNLLCIVFPVFVFGLWLLYSWLPDFVKVKFEIGLADSAFNAVAYMQLGTLIGLLSGGLLADKLFVFTRAARLWLMVASLLLCAPCMYGIGNAATLMTTGIAAASFGLFGGFFMGNIFPASFEVVDPRSRASAVGMLNFFGSIVSGFAPLLGGILNKTVGINGLLNYTACAYLGAAALLCFAILLFFPHDYERANGS